MPLDIKKQQRYHELKKKYGFDIAVLKQSPAHKQISDEDLFKSLALYHLQTTLTDSINQYVEDVEFAPLELSALVTLLFNSSGEIISNIAGQNPEYVLLCKKIALKQFNTHIEGFLNGKSKEPIS